MKIVTVAKANALEGPPVKSLRIDITETIHRHKEIKKWKEFYDAEAEKICEALTETLPQGTRHRLTRLLLKEIVSDYSGV